MNIQKILFVTKFEELWFDSLQSLLALKKTGLNHVVFLNVIERDKVAMRRGTGYQKEEEIKLREKANIRFIDWAETLFEQGMEVGVYIVIGKFVQQIIKSVEKEAVDLIVIGRQKKGKLEQFYSGSDIKEIIQRTATPVLVYKYLNPEGTKPDMPFERPLLATDWSPESQKAVEYLKSMHPIIQQVDVIHVADEKSLKGDSAMAVQQTRKESRRKLDDVCDILEDTGIQARSHVYIGDVTDEIEKAARECQSTMIIMGTSGKSSWKERWVGTTSQVMAEKSIFPCMFIPSEVK